MYGQRNLQHTMSRRVHTNRECSRFACRVIVIRTPTEGAVANFSATACLKLDWEVTRDISVERRGLRRNNCKPCAHKALILCASTVNITYLGGNAHTRCFKHSTNELASILLPRVTATRVIYKHVVTCCVTAAKQVLHSAKKAGHQKQQAVPERTPALRKRSARS